MKWWEYIWPGDWAVRPLIRYLNWQRLRELRQGGLEAQSQRFSELLDRFQEGPRAVQTQAANRQHYEVPTRFYQLVLGSALKYSCCYWPAGVTDLDSAEQACLELYVERAQLQDGQRILDLGCGWGSLSLFLARRFPNSKILAISNSATQRRHIESQRLANLEVRTCDINQLELPAEHFDRIVSIEMLEHVRNYRAVFQLLEHTLKPEGSLFVHTFGHREFAYLFEARGGSGPAADWMEREFFSGGTMPSFQLLPQLSGGLTLEHQWNWSGQHYQRTAEAWLQRMRAHRQEIQALFYQVYGRRWRRYWTGWQLFFLACSETFGYAGGQQWGVVQQRYRRTR